MPKGKSIKIGRLFTDINAKEAVENIGKYLIQNVNVPRDEKGNEIRSDKEFVGLDEAQIQGLKDNIGPKEYEYIMSNPEKVISDIEKMDIFTYGKYFDDNTISDYLRTINPDYKPLPIHEQIKREELSKKIVEKHYKYAIERNLAIAAVNSKWPLLERTYQTLLEPHFNKFSMLTNEGRKKTIISGTPEEKQEMYMEIFNHLASIDLTKIDIMDDQSLLDNFETVSEIMSISVELTAVLRNAEKAGLDLRGEEYKPLIEKLAAVKEYGYTARLRIDVLSHPLYSQVDISQIEGNYFGLNLTKADGTEIDAGEDFDNAFDPDGTEEYKGYNTFFEQIAMIQFQKKDNPVLDTKLPLDKRISKFREQFWTSGNEFMPKEPKIKKVNGEWIERDEEGYDDFEDEANLQNIDSEKAEKELMNIATEMEVPLYDEIIGEDEPLSRHDVLKQKFIDNVKVIQTVIPDFTITDEEIESYLTEDRIAMHDWAVKYNDYQKNFSNDRTHKVPPMYARALFAIYDNSGTPQAEEFNKELFEKINDPSKVGEEFRTKLFADLANRVRKIEGDKLSYDKGFNEMAKYTMENIDTLEIGMEFQKINQRRVDENGIITSQEGEVNLKNIENKAVVLGGMGRTTRETMQSDLFLTFPFDKLTMPQILSMTQVTDQLKGENKYGVDVNQITLMSTFVGFKIARDTYIEPEDRDIKFADFTTTTPDLTDIKTEFEKMRKSIVDADHWYNFNNSDKYTDLISALDESIKSMSDIDKSIDKEKSQEIFDSITKVRKSADEYSRHVGAKGKNDIQQKRLDISKDISKTAMNALKSHLVFDTMIDSHNKDVYASKQEALFNSGLKRTENLRTEVENLEKKENITAEERQLLNMNKTILEARDELTNLVGRSEVDIERIRPLLATVVMGTTQKNKLKEYPDGDEIMLQMIEKTANTKAFLEATKDFKAEDINLFLQGSGEQKLHQDFCNIYSRMAKEEITRQKNQQSYEKAKNAIEEKPEIDTKQKSKDDAQIKHSTMKL